MQPSAERILHEACEATRYYEGTYAFVPKMLRDAERHLRGERVCAGLYAGLFFANEPIHPTCMDFPNMRCPACSGSGSSFQPWVLLDGSTV